ncbi:MAG: beta-glycosidase [Muribaculaceae bacterium]|nr:beta-glycosidase [Muribaculaceae bacterium]
MKQYAIMIGLMLPIMGMAQNVSWYSSSDNDFWKKEKNIKMENKASQTPVISVASGDTGHRLKHWGTTFNELDWDAFIALSRDDQDKLMRNLFAPDGDLRFTRGRIGMNCNDYGRSWFSCDEVEGDFELKYFNIDRDKTSIIPLIRAAQKYNPHLTFWTSPWSPPTWMKINGDYPVVSSKYNNADPRKDYLLFGSVEDIDEDEMKFLGERKDQFPRRLATQDYFIQDPRYLQAYANYFSKFVDAYNSEGVPIDMVIYQNEAYSYTPYPGCAWTAEGTVRFNRDYLAPTLQKRNPDVKIYLGTFNTNRQDHVERILSDSILRSQLSGLAFQWEGREILPAIRARYPEFSYICSESECGNGDMDWKAGEHTFFLIGDNIGKGCDEWYNWNFLLPNRGRSQWGWEQNALVELDPDTHMPRYTPEYYAVKHFSNVVDQGAEILGYDYNKDKLTSVMVARNPNGKYVAIAGNFSDKSQPLTVEINGKYLNVSLPPHSFNSYIVN